MFSMFSMVFFFLDQILLYIKLKENSNGNFMSTQPIVHLVTDEEAKNQAKKLFENIKKSTGKVPKWMRVMANCDDILVGFFTMFKAIMDDSPVESRLKWLIAWKISDLNKCEYCVSVAEMQLRNFGLTEEEVKDIKNRKLNEKEQLAMDYAIASSDHAYNIDQNLVQRTREAYGDEGLVELTSVVGLFNFINRFNDSLGILPDD